jgi:replicative DNA helicase
MEYFVPNSISAFDLRLYVQKVKEKYKGRGNVRALYVDYLDLINSGKTYDLYRLELGQVTLLLKAVAVLEDIPVITATQLNREGYDKEVFSLVQMSESIKKVEHADVVALLKNQDEKDQKGTKSEFCDLEFFIGKNRCGPKNEKIKLRSKYNSFLIEDGIKTPGVEFSLTEKPPLDGFL